MLLHPKFPRDRGSFAERAFRQFDNLATCSSPQKDYARYPILARFCKIFIWLQPNLQLDFSYIHHCSGRGGGHLSFHV
ncbi:hypothetical protein Glove_103g240 [Diversispora epigaea]|uniref:Uncharacterized protein n=1 Tax=Diversispora epigaea TaxID=1348612 RepID=A0A397JCY5_9GLOM|nr:hypothetical protein Glove_103g240 [Diversispora epigaea]